MRLNLKKYYEEAQRSLTKAPGLAITASDHFSWRLVSGLAPLRCKTLAPIFAETQLPGHHRRHNFLSSAQRHHAIVGHYRSGFGAAAIPSPTAPHASDAVGTKPELGLPGGTTCIVVKQETIRVWRLVAEALRSDGVLRRTRYA